MKDSPIGWTRCDLGDVVTSMKNGIYKKADVYGDDGTPCLRMYNIDDGQIVMRDVKRMRLSESEIADYGLNEGDLLVNRVNSRELVGKTAVIPPAIGPCVFESKNIRMRVDQSAVRPEWISYQLHVRGSRYFGRNAQQVVGMASISQPQIAAFQIELPPLAEQRRIVAKVEELLGKVSACRQRLAKIPTILKRFRQSVLAAACSGRLTADWRASCTRVSAVPHLQDLLQRRTATIESFRDLAASKVPAPVGFRDESLPELPDSWIWTSIDSVCSQVTDGEHIQPSMFPKDFRCFRPSMSETVS